MRMCSWWSPLNPLLLTVFHHSHAAVQEQSVHSVECSARHKPTCCTSILFHWPKKPSRAWSTVRICLRLLSYVSHGYGRPRLTLGVTCMAGTVVLSAPSFTRRTDTSAASAPLYHTKMATLLNRPEATLEAFCHVLEIILLQLQAHMHWKLTF